MTVHYKISFAHSAISDLEDVIAFYKEQKLEHIGERLVLKIFKDVELLSGQPDMGAWFRNLIWTI